MTAAALYEVRDNIALITLNSPPVNGLGLALRSAILEGFRQAIKDHAVQGIVLASSGPIFCGGADITEFSRPELAMADPFLPTIIDEIERSQKLVVAAINGMALGGGLELALAADYRISDAAAKLGLPEVHLGILPGGGGTQRLPRLVGAKLATEMIVSGTAITAQKALSAGLIDQIGEGNLLDDAIAYIRALIDSNAALRDCNDIRVDTSELPANFFADFRQSIARKTRGFFAPERCIQCVEAAIEMPLAEGLQREQALFAECLNTPQARAQQHLFFAERAATKIPGVDSKIPTRDVKKVAVIGSGTMGGGIAMNFMNVGIPVVMLDLNAEALARGIKVIQKNYEVSASKGKLTAEQVEQRMGLLSGTTEYSALHDVDLVIEAVFEKMDVKHAVFKSLDDVCKPGCILASNTSTLNIDEIAAVTQRPQDVLGLHFFSPANVMRLLEIVRCDKTNDDVLVTCIKLAQKIKKVPVVVGVCFGFVGNRMLEPYMREGMRLLLEGATPIQIDKALTDFGMAMGLCSMGDLAGLDVGYFIREGRREDIAHDQSYCAIADELAKLGRYGQKTGRGLYIYEGRDQQEDPEVLEIATRLAAELGIERREISAEEIVERMIFSMVNAGAQILEEGKAYRSSDCDLIYTNGYGFPVWRGGPMQYADATGLDFVLSALEKYRQQLGEYGEMWFKPSSLLVKLVADGKQFKHHKVGA